MKKNWILRVALIILVLTLATACLLNGTFAKYTSSASASDSARVARWGIAAINGNAFELFSLTYQGNNRDDTINYSDNNTADDDDVISTVNVVAPGTTGDDSLTLIAAETALPEVAYKITATADVTDGNGVKLFEDWTVGDTVYCPIVLTYNEKYYTFSGKYQDGSDADGDFSALEAAVKLALSGDASGAKEYAPGQANALITSGTTIAITWKWDFETNVHYLKSTIADSVYNVLDVDHKAYYTVDATDVTVYNCINATVWMNDKDYTVADATQVKPAYATTATVCKELDAKDTLLGNIATASAPVIKFSFTYEVTQLDTYID